MEDNYSLLIRKIDEFIRKYYKNQLIRGGLYTIALVGGFFILLVLLEYFSWYSTLTRSVFFYLFLILTIFVTGKYVVLPLLKLRNLGRVISHEMAAGIIGSHFPDVKDRLLNTLQLRHSAESGGASRELIEASINQKVGQLKPIRFADAVNLKENRRYLRYALPPVLFLLAALLVSPALITGPSNRLIHHNQVFERPAPFTVEILNKQLQAVQQEDFALQVHVKGEEVPDQLFLETGGARYRMEKKNTVSFTYTFKNLQQNTSFIITADQYNSKEFVIRILPKPIILSFEIQAAYPSYLGRKAETFENTGDLTVPEGTLLNWKFYTRDTRKLLMRTGEKSTDITSANSNAFQYSMRMMSGMNYTVYSSNEYFRSRDSLSYAISVIPDLYPSITVDEFRDSVYDNRLYFKGNVKDDYGLSRLTFQSAVKKAGEEKSEDPKSKPVVIDVSSNQQQFYYFLDISTLMVSPGDEIEYYFEVWDNDGIHGPKSTKSQKRVFRIPTLDEIEKQTQEKNDDIKSKMEMLMQQAKVIQHQVDDMNKKLVDKKDIGWQEKQMLQQLLDRQKSIKEQVEQLQKENLEKSREEQQYKEESPDLLEKQKQLEKLFNEILPDEVKQMYDEMQKMLDKLDKDKISEMLEKMKSDSKDLEKQLDRNLELFKQLEFEKKMQETIDKIDKLANDQDKLSETTKDAPKEDNQSLLDKQEKLGDEFNKLKEDLKDLEKMNQQLEDPLEFRKMDDEQQSIDSDMKDSENSLKQGKNKNASQSQKKASQSMKKMGEQLSQMQEENEEESASEDESAIREILENLVKISFAQEDLMGQLGQIGTNNPRYLKIIEDQNGLKDDLQMVEDSLYAIGKRQPIIQPYVMREIGKINDNVDDATKSLNDRDVATAKGKQQYVMTSVNNLALMLAESLKQMQQQSMQKKGKSSSNGSCNKPGGEGDKMKSIRQLQEQLNKQLQQMKDGMSKPGQGKMEQRQMSEQLARMAAQQEALRKKLQEIGEENQNQGTGMEKSIKEMMQQMDQTETDLVNKRISRETLQRQQEIVTRMLESEKAMQQRELDEKRESHEARDVFYNNPARFFQYQKLKEKETEMIRTVPPALKPFYKGKVNAYFLSFE